MLGHSFVNDYINDLTLFFSVNEALGFPILKFF